MSFHEYFIVNHKEKLCSPTTVKGGFRILSLDAENVAQNPPRKKQHDIKPKPIRIMRQTLQFSLRFSSQDPIAQDNKHQIREREKKEEVVVQSL